MADRVPLPVPGVLDLDNLATPLTQAVNEHDEIITGRIATSRRTTDSAAVTSTVTESIIDTVTADLVAGRTYKIVWDFGASQSVATDNFFARIRLDNISGTQLQGFRIMTGNNGTSNPVHRETEYDAVATGPQTFVTTFIRIAGTGSLTSHAASTNPQLLYVEQV